MERLLPVEFSLAGGGGGLWGAQPIPALGCGNSITPFREKPKKTIPGGEKFPWRWRRNTWEVKSIPNPISQGCREDPGSWRSHIPHWGHRGAAGSWDTSGNSFFSPSRGEKPLFFPFQEGKTPFFPLPVSSKAFLSQLIFFLQSNPCPHPPKKFSPSC